MLNKDSSIPVYHQIYTLIKDSIDNSYYKEDSKLPPERELAEQFGVTRVTVRRAIDKLVKKGYIKRERGAGNFICKKDINYTISRESSFTNNLIQVGLNPDTKVFGIKEIDPSSFIKQKLNIENGKVWEVLRTRYADNSIISLTKSYIPVSIAPNLKKEVFEHSVIHDIFRECYKITPVKNYSIVEILLSGELEKKYMDLDLGTPMLNLSSVVKNPAGIAIEYCTTNFRSDLIQFKVRL